MRLLLLLALVGATTLAVFRKEDVERFREKNEEKIKQIIMEAESGNNTSSSEDGERSDLAGMKRDPDDSIQKHAKEAEEKRKKDEKEKEEALKEAEEENERIGKLIEGELKKAHEMGILNGGATKEELLGAELEKSVRGGLLGEEKANKARKLHENKELLGDKIEGRAPFDYLMFTMIYPTATCMADDDQVPDSCEIPKGTAQWTIHGLWPNFKDGSYPQFCDHQKYDHKQVEQLHEQMRTKWPNLFPKTPEDQLWSHEWEKHGTCSKSDPLLDSQFKYFNMSLFLLDHVNLRTRMEQKGISPRAAPYEKDSLQQTLDELMGHHVQMYCLQDKKTHESLLADIRVCMDAELKPMDCPKADIQPYVRAGTVTPNDRQPLPVPKKCADTLYYVTEVMDLSKTIDVLPPSKESDEKKDEKDDYYDDDEELVKHRNREEDEKARKLEEELMKALTDKTALYQENLRKHAAEHLTLEREDITREKNYARVADWARKYQESHAKDAKEEGVSRPLTLYVCIGFLALYLAIIIAFFLGRRSNRLQYGRLEYA
ncbi:hypothetical protein PMAYCL1PPCAC_28225 [Pristionchus mayeri]|uniref:Uncharacterized protein n=1 Tax=Pristionchus mayeri TaxID=1317129 RepID=A0AAN5D9F6_9BILA|nr:hypothetical protein PMAYCL1PPCAC_28225 [Pristionchus mayeri]